MRPGRDGFGNRVTMLYVEGPIEHIEIAVSGEVLTNRSNGVVHGTHEPLPPPLFLRPTGLTAPSEGLGAFAAETDLEVTNAPLQAKSMDHPRADEAEWVVMLEGADAASVSAAARTRFTLAALKPFGVTAAPTIGTYRLLFGNQR